MSRTISRTTKSSPLIRKALLSAAALATAAFVPAPAFAGGYGGYYDRSHHRSYYGGAHYRDYGNYRHRGYYGRGRGRGHLSGGEAALIAAGIIGGVILIDRALDDRRDRDRYDYNYDRRRYDDRYDRRYDDRDRRGAFDDDYYYQRDERYDGADYGRYEDRYDDGARAARAGDDIDDALLGDTDDRRGARPAVLADAAFRECVAETRGAAGAGGMNVAMPGAPTEIQELADGSVRMTAQFRASNARGDTWTRRFVCEADESGVRFLQVD